jgi:hypothetical protein
MARAWVLFAQYQSASLRSPECLLDTASQFNYGSLRVNKSIGCFTAVWVLYMGSTQRPALQRLGAQCASACTDGAHAGMDSTFTLAGRACQAGQHRTAIQSRPDGQLRLWEAQASAQRSELHACCKAILGRILVWPWVQTDAKLWKPLMQRFVGGHHVLPESLNEWG